MNGGESSSLLAWSEERDETPLPFRCGRCGRRLGTYLVAVDEAPIRPDLTVRSSGTQVIRTRGVARPMPGEVVRGPISGTGLHLEHGDHRVYIRLRCKCGRDQKFRPERFAELAQVRYEPDPAERELPARLRGRVLIPVGYV
jgi:hypothetical protein